MKKQKVKVLFSDLGGVLLTNGWDRKSREKAVQLFGLDGKDFESRHQLLFGEYETGKISLETYLQYTIFYQPRSFSREVFIDFMYAQSAPCPEMIDLVRRFKGQHGLKIVVISNEGRELTDYRINAFGLRAFVDFFVVSSFIGMKKPDRQVYRLALDLVQVTPHESVYLEDRELFVEIANSMGIRAIHHQDVVRTEELLTHHFR